MPNGDNHRSTEPTTDALGDELDSIVKRGQERIALGSLGLLEAEDCPIEAVSRKATSEIFDLGNALPDIVVHDKRFPGNKVQMVHMHGTALGFYPKFIGAPLIRRVLQTGNPNDAIKWLQKVLRTTRADGQWVLALWGVPVEQRIQLTPEVAIVPIEDLPDSKQKQLVTSLWYQSTSGPIFSLLRLIPPQSALMMHEQVEPFFHCPDEDGAFRDTFAATRELLSEIRLALTAVGPRAPLEAARWLNFDDPDLEQACASPTFHTQPFVEILPLQPQIYPALDPNEAPEIVQKYCALPEAVRSKLRVALQRLSQAQLRHEVGDRAVELSIALEALMGDSARTEMTHKIKVRSVRLLGGQEAVRAKNVAVISNVYEIRSKLVHTGQVDSKQKEVCGTRMDPLGIIDCALAMCIELVKIIIRRGAIPDWQTFDIT